MNERNKFEIDKETVFQIISHHSSSAELLSLQ
jgi:hypothetical protein